MLAREDLRESLQDEARDCVLRVGVSAGILSG